MKNFLHKNIVNLQKKYFKKISPMIGMPPGALLTLSDNIETKDVSITHFKFNPNEYTENNNVKIEECAEHIKDTNYINWININGIHNPQLIEKIGALFNFHPLMLEDIMHTGQRPKFEDYDKYIFIVLKMMIYQEDKKSIDIEQVSLIISHNYVISFQEKEGDVFNPIRDRIRTGKGKIRKMQSDYMAYTLLDIIVDNYFYILEKIGEEIEEIENELITHPSQNTLYSINNFKRKLIFMRRSIWPLREVISRLIRKESDLINEVTYAYYRDVYDHTIMVIDTVETSRDLISGIFDLYLSSISNKMNEIMKVLTILGTIFLPLTFIAGVYGMNFENMPELQWEFGYFGVMGLMVIIALIMLSFFKIKKWL